jgi:ribosomal-protein-alanine N-acetyltransferase
MAFPDERFHDIEIRRMTLEDVAAVAAIDRSEDPDPWTENIFRGELKLSVAQTLLAIDRRDQVDSIAGFITFWIVADELQLHKIVVSQPYRRRGIAGKLFQAMTDQALDLGLSRATLEVRRSNEAAIRFYEASGYRVTAVRKGYYDDAGEDALMMSAELKHNGLRKP